MYVKEMNVYDVAVSISTYVSMRWLQLRPGGMGVRPMEGVDRI
jgi:hypothetical protein